MLETSGSMKKAGGGAGGNVILDRLECSGMSSWLREIITNQGFECLFFLVNSIFYFKTNNFDSISL